MSPARLRLVAGCILLLSLLVLMLLTSGAAAQRVMQWALPLSIVLPQSTQAPYQLNPLTISRVDVDEGVSEEIRIELLQPQKPEATDLGGDAPRILIYHTHTTEAYSQTSGYKYEESGDWRTQDTTKNIVAVGALLANILREEYGCNVIHDTTDHEPPKLATAYSRSVETMLAYQEQYPSLTMFIDVHRDAGKAQTYAMIDGKQVARMMFVVGTGEGATGTGFAQMPDFESNYALAYALTQKLSTLNSKLMRNIRVKTGRYNQHVSSQCLLVEMGDNANTMEQVLHAVPYLARAIVECMQEGAAAEAAAPRMTPSPGMQWAPAV